jgi:tetratricopeptide (TPR) repeat protein
MPSELPLKSVIQRETFENLTMIWRRGTCNFCNHCTVSAAFSSNEGVRFVESGGIFEKTGMRMGRKHWLIVALVLAAGAAPAMADRRAEAKAQIEFGIKVAQKNLWREALARFQQGVEKDPTYAAAWNDLAIAYEQAGRMADARNAYDKAMQLDPGNQTIKTNWDMFSEFYARQGIRQSK